MNRHPAPAARRSRSYLRFAVGWGKAMGREGVSFGFPVLGHPRDLGGRRGSRRVRVHLRRVFPGTPPPSVPCRPRLPPPPPPWPASASLSSLLWTRGRGRGRIQCAERAGSSRCGCGRGVRGFVPWTSGVHDCLCLLLGGEEPLDPVLRFHGCACPGENCRSPRRNFPSTFEVKTQLSNFAEVITNCY